MDTKKVARSNQLQSNSNDVMINVEKLATSMMRNELEKLPSESSKWCIQRVPKRLRRLNEVSYTPQMVSIGPLHCNRKNLKAMEVKKKRYLRDFLQRTQVSLADFLKLIKEMEPRLRSCYAETISLNSDGFVKLILMDAVFIIEVFLSQNVDGSDYLMMKDIAYDLWLLENQLPFFILEEISRKISISWSSFTRLTYEFSRKFWNLEPIPNEVVDIDNLFSGVKHLVDFLRIYLKPPKLESQKKLKTLTIIPSLVHIHNSVGVKVMMVSGMNPFDIVLERKLVAGIGRKVLKIPKLEMKGTTETLFLNLLAFEQYHCSCGDRYVNDYIVTMSQLVKTEKDEKVVVELGIAEHWLGSNDSIKNCFGRLFQGTSISVDDFYFSGMVEMLDDCCNRTWQTYFQEFKISYFGDPWTLVNVIQALILFWLTVIQTVIGFLSLKK